MFGIFGCQLKKIVIKIVIKLPERVIQTKPDVTHVRVEKKLFIFQLHAMSEW